jgi:hypothetical protein
MTYSPPEFAVPTAPFFTGVVTVYLFYLRQLGEHSGKILRIRAAESYILAFWMYLRLTEVYSQAYRLISSCLPSSACPCPSSFGLLNHHLPLYFQSLMIHLHKDETACCYTLSLHWFNPVMAVTI